MNQSTELMAFDDISETNAPAIYVAGGLGRFIEIAKAGVEGEVPDLNSRKGRERVASLAAQVSRHKTAVEKPGRAYLKRLKEMPKVVEDELREFVTEMDALRDKVRQPLNEWQAAEDARIDRHGDNIEQIKNTQVEGKPAADIRAMLQDLESFVIDQGFEEFEEEAHRAKAASLVTLRAALAAQEKLEAEQAELARLRAEAEARAQKDRDDEIARQAAERATQAAAAQAQAERDAAAQREQALKDQAAQAQRQAEQDKRDAEAAAERQRLQLQLQAEQAERAAAQAEANRIAAEQQAERDRLAAIERQARAVEAAKQQEIQRQEAAEAEQRRQARAREADIEHRKSVNNAALEAFMANGMTEDCARLAVTLIAKRQIPHIQITY